jgi:hypothetical protein
MKHDDILALINAARDGSSEAAGKLYELHVTAVYRTVRPLCRNDDEAEDTVQETFARALESVDRYVPRPDSRFLAADNRPQRGAKDAAAEKEGRRDRLGFPNRNGA